MNALQDAWWTRWNNLVGDDERWWWVIRSRAPAAIISAQAPRPREHGWSERNKRAWERTTSSWECSNFNKIKEVEKQGNARERGGKAIWSNASRRCRETESAIRDEVTLVECTRNRNDGCFAIQKVMNLIQVQWWRTAYSVVHTIGLISTLIILGCTIYHLKIFSIICSFL